MRLGWIAVCIAAVGCGKDDEGIAPTVSILAPSEADELNDNGIDLVGLVADANGIDDLVQVTWSSSVDGVVLDDAFPVDGRSTGDVRLTPGEHVLTLLAVDSLDLRAEDSVTVFIDSGLALSVSIVTPQAEDSVVVGQSVVLDATVSGADGPLDGLLGTWQVAVDDGAVNTILSASLTADGSLQTTFETVDPGAHRFTLEVAAEGAPNQVLGRAEVTVTVTEPSADDTDNDGYTVADGDCDDTRADVNPGAEEVPDGVDNDCDGQVDNGSFTFDNDGDCFCAASLDEVCTGSSSDACDTVQPGDCNDTDPDVFPGASEVPGYQVVAGEARGVDEDCDGQVNEGFASYDNDGDCYCEDETACLGTVGDCTVDGLFPGDCDDFGGNAALRTPGAQEVLDFIDNNCDANQYIDEGTVVFDEDGDCFCEDASGTSGCADGVDRTCSVILDGDCDETDAGVNPGADDLPESASPFVDTNCDGVDGDLAVSSFVSPTGTANDCTLAAPCSLDRALVGSPDFILLSEGDYQGGVRVGSSTTLIGGYSAATGARSEDASSTRILGANGPTVTAQSGTQVELAYMHVLAPTEDATGNRTTILVDAADLTVRDVSVFRGTADDGEAGSDGQSASQSRARGGFDALPESSPFASNPLAGPLNSLCNSTTTEGGDGGRAGTATTAGGTGSLPNSDAVARGGAPNRNQPSPQDGQDSNASHGSGGAGGTQPTGATRSVLLGGAATGGTEGSNGRGGQGGGGTGGAVQVSGPITIDLQLGATGATGGAGGCAATREGQAGEPGGAAVGIWIYNGSLDRVGALTIVDGTGGNGGAGGAPGLGQPGGLGGQGSDGGSFAWDSGDGGDGADGGNSGGGGGGYGGPVIGILNVGGAVTGQGTLSVTGGLTGFGGPGGVSSASGAVQPWYGEDGDDGQLHDVLTLNEPLP